MSYFFNSSKMDRQNFNKLSISVFFPCYNDEKSISILVSDAFRVLKNICNDYEVIVIDDYSTDNSRKVLEKIQKKFKNLKLIFHKYNQGYGGTLKSGFKSALKDLVFYTDGDGQYDVKELPILYSLMTRDVNFINGIKMVRNDPNYRVVIGNLYSFIARWLFWLPIYDVDCDFRLIRRSLVKKIGLTANSGAVCIELVKMAQRAGGKFRQVTIHHFQRKYGSSQFFRPKRILFTLLEFVKIWFNLMVSKRT